MGILRQKKHRTTSIRQIWHSPPPGAPWYYWTYVLFEFVALISPEYFASPWCVRELEAAAEKGGKILPIKVSEGGLVLSPHIRNLYENKLREPAFLDIRKRNPTARLAELARQMLARP